MVIAERSRRGSYSRAAGPIGSIRSVPSGAVRQERRIESRRYSQVLALGGSAWKIVCINRPDAGMSTSNLLRQLLFRHARKKYRATEGEAGQQREKLGMIGPLFSP